ncbi:site-2 protease family protein [Rubripirellula sp.]|nr:site-2 protease family protein [Rubripirellula sp.]
MPESLLNRRLKLGRFLGISLYVHWSFALVIAYVAISSREGGSAVVAFSIAQLLGVFLCVTLHEYGHAMAARYFGIGTVDITLLPIGGVARLRRMPRIPWQELVVALAGPAVNVIIVGLIVAGLWAFTDQTVLYGLVGCVGEFMGYPMNEPLIESMIIILLTPSLLGFVTVMLIVNFFLVAFNLIPAFPMDGGRVFRSLLAMRLDYRKATMIASRVGLVCAFVMAFVALSSNPPNPIPVLIAFFIGYAGIAEARQVDITESVRGLTAGQVMIRTQASIPADWPLYDIRLCWQANSSPSLPVIESSGRVIGMLRLSDVAKALAGGMNQSTTAKQLIATGSNIGTLREEEALEIALLRTGRQNRQIPVVDSIGCLIGIVDLDSMLARAEISRHAPMTLNEFS